MKKIIAMFLVFLMAMSALVGCAAKQAEPAAVETTAAPAAATEAPKQEEKAEEVTEPIVMAIGHVMSTDSPRHLSLELFKQELEEMTNGKIQVELYPAGQLGTEAEIIEQVKMGTIQGTRGGQFEMVAPKLLIYTLPFMFDTIDEMMKVVESPVHEKIAAEAAENNMVVIAMADSGGFRQWSNNVRPIHTPADFKGLKMRSSGVLSITKTFEALGASASTITYTELYMALKTGVVDGQCNAYTQIENGKFYEVQKYVTESNYMLNPEGFYINAQWFNALTPELQEAVRVCAMKSVKAGNQIIQDNTASYIDTISKYCEMNTLTGEEIAAFRDACKPVYDYFINEEKLFTQAEFDEVMAVAKS